MSIVLMCGVCRAAVLVHAGATLVCAGDLLVHPFREFLPRPICVALWYLSLVTEACFSCVVLRREHLCHVLRPILVSLHGSRSKSA